MRGTQAKRLRRLARHLWPKADERGAKRGYDVLRNGFKKMSHLDKAEFRRRTEHHTDINVTDITK